MTRTLAVGVSIGVSLALHQYLLVVCSSTALVITLLDVAALPLAFGLPFLGGLLASRGHEHAYTRHSAIVGVLAGIASLTAVAVRWATKPGIEFSAHQQMVQGFSYLVVFGHQVAFSIVGGYVATRMKRKPREL